MSLLIFRNKKILAGAVTLFLLFVLLVPASVFGQSDIPSGEKNSLINCGNSVVGANGVTTVPKPCTFNDFVDLLNGIINWIIAISGTIFTISMIYGGFLYATSGAKPANKDKATEILWSTLKGFIIILVAWVIIHTILVTLVDTGKAENKSIFNFIGLIN